MDGFWSSNGKRRSRPIARGETRRASKRQDLYRTQIRLKARCYIERSVRLSFQRNCVLRRWESKTLEWIIKHKVIGYINHRKRFKDRRFEL